LVWFDLILEFERNIEQQLIQFAELCRFSAETGSQFGIFGWGFALNRDWELRKIWFVQVRIIDYRRTKEIVLVNYSWDIVWIGEQVLKRI
jgi:hypothetical protein